MELALDVVGKGYEQFPEHSRKEIIKQYPRTGFKKKIILSFFEGFTHKPETTQGNLNADICAYMMPDFHRKNFCDLILNAPWAE